MLVLSRKVGEKLLIGDDVTVEIVRIKGNRVTIGITAPEEVKVLRGELKQHTVELSKVELQLEPEAVHAC